MDTAAIFSDANDFWSGDAEALDRRTVIVSARARGAKPTTMDKIVLWDVSTGRIIARVDEEAERERSPSKVVERGKIFRDAQRLSAFKAKWGPSLGMVIRDGSRTMIKSV